MIMMIFLVHRRSDLTREEFRRYWAETHANKAAEIPGLRKYTQHHAVPGPDGTEPPYDGFAETWWDDAAAMHESLETPEGQATVADTKNFIDLDRQLVFTMEQKSVV